MGRLMLTAVSIAALLGAAAGASSAASKPSLRLASMQPLVVRGASFKAHERVRVRVSDVTTQARSIRASRTGSFVTRFENVTVTRCDLVRVVATGSSGSRAAIKILPSPACLAE